MADHVRQGLFESHALLLYRADPLCDSLLAFLARSGARRAALTGECRRRKEVIEEISFVVECDDFAALMQPSKESGSQIIRGRYPCGRVRRSAKGTGLYRLLDSIKIRNGPRCADRAPHAGHG